MIDDYLVPPVSQCLLLAGGETAIAKATKKSALVEPGFTDWFYTARGHKLTERVGYLPRRAGSWLLRIMHGRNRESDRVEMCDNCGGPAERWLCAHCSYRGVVVR